MGSLGARVSRTRTIPGVYSLMVPVISAPVLGSGLPLVGWASAMATKRMVVTKTRSGLIMGFRQRFACPLGAEVGGRKRIEENAQRPMSNQDGEPAEPSGAGSDSCELAFIAVA